MVAPETEIPREELSSENKIREQCRQEFPTDELISEICKTVPVSEAAKGNLLRIRLERLEGIIKTAKPPDPSSPSDQIKTLKKYQKSVSAVTEFLDFPDGPDCRAALRNVPHGDLLWKVFWRVGLRHEKKWGPVERALEYATGAIYFSRIRDGMHQIQDAIEQIILDEKTRKGPASGNRRKPDIALRHVLHELTLIYQEVVGRRPRLSRGVNQQISGPLIRFVTPVIKALGWDLSPEALGSAIRRMLEEDPPNIIVTPDPK